jgi:arsenite-transporting ATPase
MLDRLGDALFEERDASAVLHASLAHELDFTPEGATIRLDLPLSEKGDIALKKIGLELVVRVNGHKRTLLLPPALAGYSPAEASFVDGALEISFQPPGAVPVTMVAADG